MSENIINETFLNTYFVHVLTDIHLYNYSHYNIKRKDSFISVKIKLVTKLVLFGQMLRTLLVILTESRCGQCRQFRSLCKLPETVKFSFTRDEVSPLT